MADVLVSYRHADRTRVEAIVGLLEAAGLSVWWDTALDGGDRYRPVIDHELQQARCVVVVWSKTSVTSEFVIDEAEKGRDRQILVPCRLDGTPLPLGFDQRHTADLRGWTGATDDRRARRLVAAVRRVVEKIPGRDGALRPSTRRGRGRSGPDAVTAAVNALAVATQRLWLKARGTWSLTEDAPVLVSWDRSPRPTMLSADVVERLYREVHDRSKPSVVIIAGEAGIGKSTAMCRCRCGSRLATGAPRRASRSTRPARSPACSAHADLMRLAGGMAWRLVEERRVALFLDGLDELPDERREKAAHQINVMARTTRVVLTVRPGHRGIAHDRRPFDASVLVRLLPVDASVAAEFLTRDQDTAADRPALRELAAILRTDPEGVVAGALRTPLMIGLAIEAFGTARSVSFTPRDLAALDSPKKVISQLVGLFLDRAYPVDDAGGRGRDDRRRARRIARERAAMTWITRCMDKNRDLVWWRMPAWVHPRSISLRVGLATAALVAAILLVAAPFLDADSRLLSISLAAMIYFVTEIRCRRSIGKPPSTVRWRWPPLRHVGKVVAMGALGGVLAGGAVLGIGGGLPVAAMVTGSFILMAVLSAAVSDDVAVGGLLASSTFSLADSSGLTPRDAYRTDGRRAVRISAVGAMAGGLVMARLGLFQANLGTSVLFGGCMGLALGWVGGLGPSGLLAFTRPSLPGTRWSVRLMPTLRSAVDKKVLRQAGLVYQFRHAALPAASR